MGDINTLRTREIGYFTVLLGKEGDLNLCFRINLVMGKGRDMSKI